MNAKVVERLLSDQMTESHISFVFNFPQRTSNHDGAG